jgi:hypothetical protein
MSLKENDIWIEGAYENFHTALEQNDVKLCNAIIADVFDRGYAKEADIMKSELNEKQS